MKYARVSVKIMRAYAHVFTVGEPAAYYYHGWVEWYSGRKDKAYQSWRRACEKAQAFPMYYECGMSYLALGNHLPVDSAERSASLEKAQEAFKRGGFDHWAEVTHRARET